MKLKEKYEKNEKTIETFSDEFLNNLSLSVQKIKNKIDQPKMEDIEIEFEKFNLMKSDIFEGESEYIPEIKSTNKTEKKKKEKLFKDTGSDIFIGEKLIKPKSLEEEILEEEEGEIGIVEVNHEIVKKKTEINQTDEYAECYPSAYENYSNIAYNSDDDDVDFEKMKQEYSVFKEEIESQIVEEEKSKKRKSRNDKNSEKTNKKKKNE
jgi:hypothetical protein